MYRSLTSSSFLNCSICSAMGERPVHIRQLLYETCLRVWLLSYYEPAVEYLATSRSLPRLIDVLRGSKKEKVIRVIVLTLKNLLSKGSIYIWQSRSNYIWDLEDNNISRELKDFLGSMPQLKGYRLPFSLKIPAWFRDCLAVDVLNVLPTANGGTIEVLFMQLYTPTTLAPTRDFWPLRYTTVMEDMSLVVCERFLNNTQNSSMPPVLSFERAEILPSGYLIRPCDGGGSVIHIVDHMNLETWNVPEVKLTL